jgi:hypothetical protein
MVQKTFMRGLGRRCEWKTLSEYVLDQILAQAVHKLSADRIMEMRRAAQLRLADSSR